MVVRLVEEQHVRLLDQQPRQPDQLLLAAAELADRLIARAPPGSRARPARDRRCAVSRAAIEPFQDHRVGIHDGSQLVVAGGLAHHPLELARPRLQRGGVAGGEGDRLAHRLTGIEIGLLAEESDPRTARQRERAALRPELPGHQPEEGALARPIRADQRQAVPLANLEGGAGEHIVSAIGVFDVRGLDQQRHEGLILATRHDPARPLSRVTQPDSRWSSC